MDGAVLARYALTAGFKLLTERWSATKNGIPEPEFLALLSINPIARAYFVENFLLASEGREIRKLFFSGWASYQLTGGSRLEESWISATEVILASYAQELSECTDESVINWLLVKGLDAAKPESPWLYVHTTGTFGGFGGVVWWCISNEHAKAFSRPQVGAIDAVHALVTSGIQVPYWVLGLWDTDPLIEPSSILTWSADSNETGSKLRDILAVLLLAAHEEELDGGEMNASSQCWPGRISCVAAYRDWKHGVGSKLTADDEKDALATIAVLPAAIRRWTNGGRYLLEDSRLV